MKIREVLGIDVSKLTLDLHLHESKDHEVFSNDRTGFKKLIAWTKSKSGCSVDELLICFEHTGIYSYALSNYLSQKKIRYCVISSLEIKRSMGLVRGKNDQIDSSRIAKYAYLRREELKAYKMPGEEIQKVSRLLTLRDRMIKQRVGYQSDLSELKRCLKKKGNEILFKSSEQMIDQLTKQVNKIESEIKSVIASDDQLQEQYDLITSVKGVGLILATNLMVSTDCFTKFDDSRKFASYAGVAPFAKQSGTSVKGKTQVSHLANKKMKTLLNTAALSAIMHDPELKKYYHERVNNGKDKMSTLNVVRNKIVHRVFAVVKRGTPFVQTQQHMN